MNKPVCRELASPTTCLPLGTSLLRKDVGRGPGLQKLPGSSLLSPSITIPSFEHTVPMYFTRLLLAFIGVPSCPHPPYHDYPPLNLSVNTNMYELERVNMLTQSCSSQEGISHQAAEEEDIWDKQPSRFQLLFLGLSKPHHVWVEVRN